MLKWTRKIDEHFHKQEFEKFFYNIFIIDALLLNWDRNPTNWGVIAKSSFKNNSWIENDIFIAPLIDHGSTLFAKQDSKGFEEIKSLNNIEDIDKIIYNTKSFFLDDHNQKIVYLDFFNKTNDFKMFVYLDNFFDSINLQEILLNINTLNLPAKYKTTYCLLISRSYELIKKSLLKNQNYINFKKLN